MVGGININLRSKPALLSMMVIYTIHFYIKQTSTDYTGWAACYLGDLLCLPIMLSVALVAMQNLTKQRVQKLSALQVFFSFIIVSIHYEWFFPTFFNQGVIDLVDIIYYGIGGFVFYLLINPKNRVGTVLEKTTK